jgi:hypothetical protein
MQRKCACGDRLLPTPPHPPLPSVPIPQVGVSDPQHVFCHWTCHGTNLHPTLDSAGRPHKPTFHESVVSGIDYITFCDDRSRMREVVIYRCVRLLLSWEGSRGGFSGV